MRNWSKVPKVIKLGMSCNHCKNSRSGLGVVHFVSSPDSREHTVFCRDCYLIDLNYPTWAECDCVELEGVTRN